MKTILSLLVMVVCAVPAFAHMKDMPMNDRGERHGHMMGMGPMDMMGMCLNNADKLGLTKEQIAKIKPIHTDMQKKQAMFAADRTVAELELKEIMDVKDFDLQKANAAVKKISDIKMNHQLEMLKDMKEVHSILTEDQFSKMKKMDMMPMKSGMKKPAKKMMMKK